MTGDIQGFLNSLLKIAIFCCLGPRTAILFFRIKEPHNVVGKQYPFFSSKKNKDSNMATNNGGLGPDAEQ